MVECFDIHEEDCKKDDICWQCEMVCIVFKSEKYKGYLGYCQSCDNQWRCS